MQKIKSIYFSEQRLGWVLMLSKVRWLIFVFLVFLVLPNFCWAADLEGLKVDFLQGNYRRVIFEGQAQTRQPDASNADELNYLLGLSYLKEFKLELAGNCFRRILDNPHSEFKEKASLALADSYLVGGQLAQAEDIYNQLMASDSSNKQKPAILYRLSQLEFKRKDYQKSNDYRSQLKREFPLSPEVRLTKGILSVSAPADQSREYSIQVGFFSRRLNADNFKNSLLSKNYPAYVESFNAGYRVKVGKFRLQQEALDLANQLARDGLPTKICQP